jgi:periplasmic divalent cation tolerance protein
MPQPLIVMTTYPNDGRKLSRLIKAILHQRLAKCIQRVNYLKSYYLWQGKLKRDEEKLLLIKTTDDQHAQLVAFLTKQHPYEVPEIITLQPQQVNESYLKRLSADTST